MRVLICTMLHPRKAYCYPHFFNWAKVQTHRDSEFFILSHSGAYGEKDAVKQMREQCRQEALRLEMDALFFIDVDTIPPDSAIDLLLDVDGDIVTGIYFLRNNNTRAVCWKHEDNDQVFLDAEPVSDIDGAGMGCCLIHRRVLEAIGFDHEIPDDDYPYWAEARRRGFRLKSLNVLRCRHYGAAQQYSYRRFGAVQDAGLYQYEVRCPDGVTVNGSRYLGRILVADPKVLETVKALDELYDRTQSHVAGRVDTVSPKQVAHIVRSR